MWPVHSPSLGCAGEGASSLLKMAGKAISDEKCVPGFPGRDPGPWSGGTSLSV
jgi:hypothetical protein